MGRHTRRYVGKAMTRQEVINERKRLLAIHRKDCKNGCVCDLAQMDLPTIPNE
jgi:hypothetical protein